MSFFQLIIYELANQNVREWKVWIPEPDGEDKKESISRSGW